MGATVGEQTLLEAEDLHLHFGGVSALSGVGFTLAQGELHAMIGPNGAGKTSVLNVISGIYRPQAGRLRFAGRNLLDLKPYQVAQAGIARSFQNIELFQHMSVLDNLLVGRHRWIKAGVLACGLFLGRGRRQEIAHRRRAEEIIDFLEIEHIRHARVGNLPYGLQKRVELGRALALEPKLLLLDEPVAGMNVEETEDIARFILDIKEELGITILLVEHDMRLVMDISDRVTVLDFGKKIAAGTPQEVARNQAVIEAYLGEPHEAA
ncbi:MAG: ABC transporter ATP-binding protein [Candidatus Tectomicrobia bacterium]|nr:ABC transporter ATP-binding protein [Candidatus Tectomicrobia bacterium]